MEALATNDWLDNVTSDAGIATADVITSAISEAIGGVLDNLTMSHTDNSTDGGLGPYQKPPQTYYMRLARGLWIYCAPVLIVVGTIGNVLSAIVMLRKELCHASTTSLYLAVLAFVDTAILYTGLLRVWISKLSDKDIRTSSEVSCRLHPFLTYALMQYQSWIIVNVAVERTVAVYVPHKTSMIFTRGRAIICLIVTAVLVCCANFHFFFTMHLDTYSYLYEDYDGDGVDDPTPPPYNYCKEKSFITKVWPWIDLSIFSLVPSAILIGCNVAIILKMARVRHTHGRSAAAQSRFTSMTVILLAVSFVFLVSTAPVEIFLLMNEFLPKTLSTDKFNERLLAWSFISLLVYVNNVSKFFLYCISGTRFRREVVDMLRACVGKKRVHKEKVYILSETKTTAAQLVSASTSM